MQVPWYIETYIIHISSNAQRPSTIMHVYITRIYYSTDTCMYDNNVDFMRLESQFTVYRLWHAFSKIAHAWRTFRTFGRQNMSDPSAFSDALKVDSNWRIFSHKSCKKGRCCQNCDVFSDGSDSQSSIWKLFHILHTQPGKTIYAQISCVLEETAC